MTESSLEFTIDTLSPEIISVAPLGKLADTFDHLDLTFNENVSAVTCSSYSITYSSGFYVWRYNPSIEYISENGVS